MRRTKFFDQVRQSAGLNRIVLPDGTRTRRNWPLCMTCLRDVDACELKHFNNHSAEIVMRCHGAEDSVRVEFPYRIEGDPFTNDDANYEIKRAMADACPFDPTRPSK